MIMMDFKHQFSDLLYQINQHMNNTFTPLYCPFGLTPAQIRLLLELQHHTPQTIGDLSRNLCLAYGNTSAMCKKLSGDGYLRRSRSQADERIVEVTLTASGQEAIQQIEACLEKKFMPVFTKRSQENLSDILKGLHLLNELLADLRQAAQDEPSAGGDTPQN